MILSLLCVEAGARAAPIWSANALAAPIWSANETATAVLTYYYYY